MTLFAICWGEVAYLNAPISGIWFLVVGLVAVVCLDFAGFAYIGSVRTASHWVAPQLSCGLATFAVLLMVLDVFRSISVTSALTQVLVSLSFLLGARYFAGRRAYLAAMGAAGFYATAIAMIVTNCRGGWVGFGGIRIH